MTSGTNGLFKNYYQEYLKKVYDIFKARIDAGERFTRDGDQDYTAEDDQARGVLLSTAYDYQAIMTELDKEGRDQFIALIQGECSSQNQNDSWAKTHYTLFGTFFHQFGLCYADDYREMAERMPTLVLNRGKDNSRPALRLNWETNANKLYYIFAKCLSPASGRPFIGNSAEDIADFILAHFDGITANKKTIVTEISRYRTGMAKPPKDAPDMDI
jgi:hypothetical protein